MAKNRLIKSSKGNGYGILDEETNMVTPVSFDTNKLIESKKGNGFGLQFGDSVVPVDISGLGKSDISLFKKKVDTELSGKTSSMDGKSDANKEDFISSLSFLDAASYGTGKLLLSGNKKEVKELTPQEKEFARVERVKRDALDEVVRSNAFLPAVSGFMKNTAFAGGVSKLASNAATALGAITEAAVNFADDIVNPKISLAAPSGFGLEGFRQTDFDIAKAREEYSKPRKKSSESVASDLYTFGNTLNKLGDSYLRNSSRSVGVKEQNIGKGFTELIGEGENADAFLNLGVQAFSQLPQVAALSATGGGAAAVFAGSAALGTAASLGEEFDKDGDITATNAIKSIGKGIVEGVTETIFRTDIQAARQLGKSLFTLSGDATQEGLKALIKQEGKEAVKEALVRDTGQVFKKAFGGSFEEGIEEVLAATGSFVIDRLEDGKWNQKNFDQLLMDASDSFFIGAATGGFISGASARMSMQPLTIEQQKKIEKFNEIANNEELSQDVRDIAKSKVNEIVKFSTDLAEKDYGLLARLPITQRQDAFDILSKIKTIEDEKSELKDESLLEAAEKTIDGYRTQVDSIIGSNETRIQQEFRDALKTATEKDNEAVMSFLGDNNILEQTDAILAPVSQKVANKEDIQDTVVNETTDKLYNLLDLIDSSEILTPQQKLIASQPIDEEISKLEGYEFTAKYDTTETFTKETTRTTREIGRVERENARKTKVTANRFNGQFVRFTDENGNAINTIAKVDDSGTITLQEQPKLGKPAGKPIVVDSNFLEFKESKFDEDGNVVGAVLQDTSNNSTIQVSNPELAMDLAIKAKQDKLGPISDAIFEQAVTEVLTGQELETTKEYINRNKAKQAAQQTQAEEIVAPQTEVPTSPVGLPSRRAYVVEEDVETKKGNKILNKIAPETKKRIGNYVKALKATIPNSTVVLYDNKTDMIEGLVNQGYSRQEATKSVNESDGLYAGSSNTIHIDVMRMDKTTLPHEIFHPVVARLAAENPTEFIALRERITKVLSGSNIKELDAFAKLYADQGEAVEAEEFLAQLAGLVAINKAKMERGTLMKLALAVKEFLKKVAAKTKSKSLSDFADSIFKEQTKTDDLIKFFEGFGQSLRQGEAIDVQGLGSTVDLLGTEAYEDGISVEISPDSISDKPTIKSSKIGKYSFPEGAVFESVELPSKSLKELVKEYNGRVIIITSDATGYGVDSLGEPILGGFGFSTIKKNIEDGIGFASVSEGAVKSTMSRAYNVLGEGKAAVLIMIQPPFTTIGNSYGVKYFARGLKDIATKSPKQLASIKKAMKDYILGNKSITNELEKEDAKTGKRNTEKALFDLIDSINANTDVNQFTQEFLKDTTFNSRTAIINGFMIDSLNIRTNAKTDPVKLALKNAGFSKVDFLNEYGDKSFLTEDMIKNNIGNFVVGGFEVDIKSEQERNDEISGLQSKGIEHPLFNGKLGGTNHFVLDGLYDVNENFSEYAVPESAIDMPESERDSMVRELYPNDNDYKPASRKKTLEERKYTDLLAERKIAFKKDVLMPKGLIKFNKANVAASVARSMGFNLESGKREDLKAAEFKQRQKDTLRQQKTQAILSDEIRNAQDSNNSKNNVYRLSESGEFAFIKSFINNKLSDVANKLSNRKFSALIRKHINPDFNAANYSRKGMSFEDLLYYLDLYEELSNGKNDADFASLFNDANIDIPEPNTSNVFIAENANKLAAQYQDGNNSNLNESIDLLFGGTDNTLRQQKTYPDALEDSRKAYLAKFKDTPQEVSRYVRKLLFERNINVKKAMQDAKLEFSLYTMYNKAGASMFGNLKFTELYNEIYGKLSPEEIKLVDNFVFLRRVIAIDTNFDNRNIARPKHTSIRNIDGAKETTNKESALAALADYNDLLGEELYDKIYGASDSYFKAFSNILKYKYDNGLINKETYELYKDYNYSPRKFLEFVFGTSISEEAELSSNNFYQRGLALSKKELASIKDGSNEEIFADSAKLLHAAMIATEVRVASNLALKTLYNEAIPANLEFVKEVEYEKYQDGTIKVNADGSLKYDKTADKGFRIVTFKENGVVNAFQLKESLAKEYFDEELFDKNSKAYKFAQVASGANILRNMATGMNIAFPITNIPVDVISQVQLNNIYDGAGVGVAGQYAKAFTGTIGNSFKLIPLEWGMKNKALEDLIYEYGKAGGLMMSMSQEYAAKDKFFGAMAKYLGSFGNASEMASKLTAYKAAKEREIKLFTEKNGSAPTGEDLSKIQTKAAFIARSAMDYHRGGLLTKWLDGFIPYLNVFSQASKITADYIRNNPTEFTKKITQAGIFVMGLTIYNMYAAGDDYDNDDNEQDLATKLVFFAPFKNADGTRGKLEFATPGPVKAFLNIFQNIGEGIYYQLEGDKREVDEWKIKANAKFLNMFSTNLSTNIPPALKAMIEYSYNLDLWRNKDITSQLGKVLPQDEGKFDKNVAEFYKIIGSATGASPIRLQKASENFITQSNPIVGLGYALMDKSINAYTNMPESQRSKFDKGNISDIPVAIFDKVIGRVASVTDPKVTYSKANEIIDKINQTAGSKKQEVKAEMKLLVEKNASVADLNKFLLTQDPIYRRVALEYREMLQNQKALNYPNNKGEYFDVMTGENAEAKAQILYAYFPYLLEPGNEKLQSDLKRLKLYGDDTKIYFNKYVKNKGIPK
jgi:hypothetical protein